MRDLAWKTLDSTYIYKDRWFIARADKCQMPNGKIVEPYYVLEFPNWGNAVVITEDEKLVMVRQYRHALNKVTIELPGGVIDQGESPEEAIKREIIEETGFVVNEIDFLYKTSPNPATNNNQAFFYLALGAKLQAAQHFDPFEDMDVLLYSKDEAVQLFLNGGIEHGVQVGAMYAAFLRLGWI